MFYPVDKDKVAVYYHSPCMDGAMAAAVFMAAVEGRIDAPRAFDSKDKYTVTYIPAQYGKTPCPEPGQYDMVYLLDFTFPAEEIYDLVNDLDESTYVTVIDHHASAIKDFEEFVESLDAPERLSFDAYVEYYFDTERSGARLTYDVIQGNVFEDESEVPPAVLYVEDRDLWRFKLPNTKAFCARLALEKMEPATFKNIMLRGSTEDYVSQGRLLLKAQESRIDQFIYPNVTIHDGTMFGVRGAKVADCFRTEALWAVCNTCTDVSEAAHRIAEVSGAARVMLWNVEADGQVKLSFRSSDPEKTVLPVAKAFGGGGHPTACGARVSLETLMSILKNIRTHV